jgi:hypothetical protein
MPRIRMVLASAPGEPAGNVDHRLELTAALTPQAALDEAAYGAQPWPALRILPDGTRRSAALVRVEGGWALQGPAGEDSALWDFEGRVFRPGEYVTVRRAGGEELLFRIVEVGPD